MFVEHFWFVVWELGAGGVSDRMSVAVEAGRCVFTGDGSGAHPGLNINHNLAVSLCGACDFQTLLVSKCTARSRSKITPWSEVIRYNGGDERWWERFEFWFPDGYMCALQIDYHRVKS
ncbi:hypothetical protein HanIR_Chr17g0891001 [Helianthus annuus]|nr:hypothetical protein HanIR_Chr17g0891001 [Helianthus annuus]